MQCDKDDDDDDFSIPITNREEFDKKFNDMKNLVNNITDNFLVKNNKGVNKRYSYQKYKYNH